MATNSKTSPSKELTDAAEAARQAAELAAINIQKYLEANTGTRAQGNNMIMHEEQFSKVVQSSAEFAKQSLERFLGTKK